MTIAKIAKKKYSKKKCVYIRTTYIRLKQSIRHNFFCDSEFHAYISIHIERFQSCDKMITLLHKTVANVLHDNRVKFPEDLFLVCSIHQQHGGDDVR